MENDLDEKLIEILRILAQYDRPVGAKIIADELRKRGYELGERAVRYHLQLLDEKGLTEKIGYYGRVITEKGLEELNKANISYRVGFVFSKMLEKIYLADFPKNIVVNRTMVKGNYREIKELVLKVVESGFSIGDFIKIRENRDSVTVETPCSITFDSYLMKNSIFPMIKYGGVVKFEDYEPVAFEGVIDFSKSSIDPLEAFITRGKTDVLGIVENGEGYLPANFRVIPKITLDRFESILKQHTLDGILSYGEENVLGLCLKDGEIGVVLVGGLSPICPLVEKGYPVKISAATDIVDISYMERVSKRYLKPVKRRGKVKIVSVFSKMLSMIHRVDYNIEKGDGKVLINRCSLDRRYEKEVLEALDRCYKKGLIVSDRIGFEYRGNDLVISTICSSTIDGILIRYGVPVIPYYGGILEFSKDRFIEIISYDGTSLDPHEIFLNRVDGEVTVLSGVRKAPMVARDRLIEILKDLNWRGVYKIGKPNNDICGVKVDKNMFGYISFGGMNPFAILKSRGLNIEVSALHGVVDYSRLIPIEELI
ncbi:MAG TPA: DUF128 domain-containing protein [Methanothermococcus okinawensis]|uniref:DUF128 domain-containing protein n=1 Tax=Methanothermococcus okinawensis TaxID=155863 RepID=A0A832Z7S8_9EURY|nr:DUF128 domain-containing protein [Methanococcaceae archaeon]HIP84447.1 DUF128 domain-containing protein [Methanothermococcus okinawensis]HIP90910.1 DUF128 domain-containing protein [Methanothermococcus okinawensis]